MFSETYLDISKIPNPFSNTNNIYVCARYAFGQLTILEAGSYVVLQLFR